MKALLHSFLASVLLMLVGTSANAQIGQLQSAQVWGNCTASQAPAAPCTIAQILGQTTPLPLNVGGTAANLTASNGGIVWSNASQLQILSGTATARQMLQSGATATPAWSTATWPATTTINQILYSSSANTVVGLATINGGLLNTSATGVPSLTATPVLGLAGTTVGTLGFQNATSGTITITPPTGALGTVTLTLPDLTSTISCNGCTQTFTGNNTFSGQGIFTGTSAPASAAGNTVILGTASAPTLTNTGQAYLYNIAANGAILQGDGSSYDVSLYNKGGSAAAAVPTGTQFFDILTNPQVQEIANAGSTGTTVNKLAKLTGTPSTAVIATTSDTTGNVVGIVAGGAGTTGNAQIATAGQASCVFDGAITSGHYVQVSTTAGGLCHDAGATFPTTGGQILGIIIANTNASPGSTPQAVTLYPPGILATAGSSSGTVTTLTPGGGVVSSITAACSQSNITTTGTLSKAECVNAQTGTSYAIADGDRAKLITASNSAAQAYTIAQAGTASNFQGGWYTDIRNVSTAAAGIVTVTPTTSTINGAASIQIYPGQSVRIVSDGTNYQTPLASVLPALNNTLGADVNLNNTATYFDGPSVAQGTSGTWFASGCVTVLNTASAAQINIKLYDGTTIFGSGSISVSAANNKGIACVSGMLSSPSGNIRIAAEDASTTSGVIKFNVSSLSKDSYINVVRVQ